MWVETKSLQGSGSDRFVASRFGVVVVVVVVVVVMVVCVTI
jgi:hypothetical protein